MARDLAAEKQRSCGVGGREYLSGRHSNAVSINVPGHLLNQATAVRLDDVQLSPKLQWTFYAAKSIKNNMRIKNNCETEIWSRGSVCANM